MKTDGDGEHISLLGQQLRSGSIEKGEGSKSRRENSVDLFIQSRHCKVRQIIMGRIVETWPKVTHAGEVRK